MKKVFITKNKQFIKISCDGKNLLIVEDNDIFNELNSLTKEEIKEWYLSQLK